MELTSANQFARTSTGTAPSDTQGGAGQNALTSDFETFLRMLTAQARYQDPLEPIDSTEYAAQLAQFSMVEQQVQTNEMLGSLQALLGQTGISGLANWVGMDVRVSAPVAFAGDPLTLHLPETASDDDRYLVVYDEDGSEITRSSLGSEAREIQWDGTDSENVSLPHGTYILEVETRQGETVTGRAPVEYYARINEAQNLNGSVMLVLANGISTPSTSVSAVRSGAG